MPAPLTSVERQQLVAFYDDVDDAPQWIDASGRPSGDARAALSVLTGAAGDALEPADYAADALSTRAASLEAASAPDVAAFDVGLSASLLRYLRHLHSGRVDPRSIGFRMTAPADGLDVVAVLRSALANHRVVEAAAELAPPLVLYRSLRSALARYRAIAVSTPDPAFTVSDTVKPGDRYADAATLRRYLVALGDLPSTATATDAADSYDPSLVDGVKHFQMRHGLEVEAEGHGHGPAARDRRARRRQKSDSSGRREERGGTIRARAIQARASCAASVTAVQRRSGVSCPLGECPFHARRACLDRVLVRWWIDDEVIRRRQPGVQWRKCLNACWIAGQQ
jgi:hypothetical protein